MLSLHDLVQEYRLQISDSHPTIQCARGLLFSPEVAKTFLGPLETELRSRYRAADSDDPNNIMVESFAIGQMLGTATLSPDFLQVILERLERLGFTESSLLLIRPDTSSPLDNPVRIVGVSAVAPALMKMYREHYSNGLIRRFENPHFDPFESPPTLVVQENPSPECSGLVLSFDPKSSAREFVVVYSTWGLAEDIVRRTVNRDEYWFHKRTLAEFRGREVYSRAGEKEFQLHYDSDTHRLEHLDLSREKARSFSLSSLQARELALLALEKENETLQPMELSWSGHEHGLMISSCRPVQAPPHLSLKFYHRLDEGEVLTSGRSASHAVATGMTRVIRARHELESFQSGEVLIAKKTEPDWEPYFRKAAAIVTELDRRTSHSTILAREMGIPALLESRGCLDVSSGRKVTVSCCEGETGYLFAGEIKHGVEEFSLARMPRLKTELMVNLSLPERALFVAQHPWSGAGLVRSEFLIGSWVKIHPCALLYPERLNRETKIAVERLTRTESSGTAYFLSKMVQALGIIAGAFWPRPVTVRLSDFKSNEYSRLLGGVEFEPKESQPMLGWRGASRYLHPEYEEAFDLELQALATVRQELGFTNLKVMIPFCRTPEEGEELVEVIRSSQKAPNATPMEVWGMAELPSNVVMADEFADVFDGLSIGSSDLTSLTLGVARDSEYISDYFDEMHPVMMKSYQRLIDACAAAGKPTSFCGQIASSDPEFAALLVEMGIDILSLAPDALHPVLRRLSSTSAEV